MLELLRLQQRIWRWIVANFKYLVLFFLLILGLHQYVWRLQLPDRSPSIICSFGTGRLGNQMSSFASLYAFSRLHGYKNLVTKNQSELLEFYFVSSIKRELHILEEDYRDYYFNLFGFSLNRLSWVSPWESVNSVADNFNYSIISSDYYVTGKAINGGDYPNEVRFFVKVLPDIRNIFRLQKRFRKSAEEKLQLAKSSFGAKNPVFVSVHIRRGDYGEHLDHLYHLPLLDGSYFNKAMSFFNSRFESVIFVVVSDDLGWARQNIQNKNTFFLGNDKVLEKDIHNPLKAGEDIGEDLALLASCNHTIMSYGTFGMWGSLLAGGQVVAPSSFLHTKEGKEVKAAGLIKPGGWHVIDLPGPAATHSGTLRGSAPGAAIFAAAILVMLVN